MAQANRNRCARSGGSYGGLNSLMNLIEHKYNLTSDGVGGTHSMGIFYPDGGYWKSWPVEGSVHDGISLNDVSVATT